MKTVLLDRFSGGNDPEGWILRAEQYFTYLGFSEQDWLPLPSFYLDGEALIWFTWLLRNKQFFDWRHFTEKLLMRFPQRTFTDSVSMADPSRAYVDYVRYATFAPPATSVSPVAALSHFRNSSALEYAFTSGNSEADQMLDKLPEKYTNVDSLVLVTGSDTEIATLEGLEALQIRNENSVAADLVQEPSSLIEAQVFDEISQTAVSSNVPELNDRFGDAISLQTNLPAAVSDDTKESHSVAEETSRDNVAWFDKSPQRDASGFLVHFAKQGTVMLNTRMRIAEIECPIATRVSLVVPIVSREAVMPNEHIGQDVSAGYIVANSLGSGSPKWKTDLATFQVVYLAEIVMEPVGIEDLCLDKYFLENESTISTSAMHSVELLLVAENVDPCVWDPGIGFKFVALTSYTVNNVEELPLLGFTDTFFLITYSNSMSRVWDPGQRWCVNSYLSNECSIVYSCIPFTCPSIAYTLVFDEYCCDVQHEVLAANYKHTSVLHLHYIIVLATLLLEWKVIVLRSGYKVKLHGEHHSAGYTLYGTIEMVDWDARHRLHDGLAERFGGRRASNTIPRYLEVNNFCFDESEHVKEYYLYHILSDFGAPFDPNSSLGEILNIPLSATTTYILVNHGNISFDRKGIDAKEEWREKGIAAPISHMCELLLENMTKVPCMDANSAYTRLGDIIRCIALLDTSHIITQLCHVHQQLSKNDATMSIILQAANQVVSLLLTNLTIPRDAHAYLNLEDKVLIGVGGIVMNGPRPVVAKQPNTTLSGYVWDPG